jgi:dihydroflavonol-4-reductase
MRMSLKAFVTGATGFVGSNLVRELCHQGWEVAVLARPESSLEAIRELPVRVRTGDLVDAASVLGAMPEHLDAVFHVAASTSVWSGNNAQQERINVGGTRNVIEAALERGARRMIHTSSFTTWGISNALLTENSPRTDATDWINYVRTKHISELMVRQAAQAKQLDAVILNPANILGPGDRHNWSRMIRMVQHGKLPGIPPGGGPFCDVREVAKAHVAAYHHGGRGETYLLGGEDASFLEVIRIVGEILGKPVPARTAPAWQLQAAARIKSLLAAITGKEPDITPESAMMIVHHIRCDSSRAQRELDYRFTPLRPLLRDTIDWLQKAGMMD